uniref:non-specific serine/threonine protein kinase n=1 Tax=Latimeria chalumnae TaxID=7897 RepID=H3B976_LATCH
MGSRRPLSRSYSGNGRYPSNSNSNGPQNGEELVPSNTRADSRNYFLNVRPENRSTFCTIIAQLTEETQPCFENTLKSRAVSEDSDVKFTCTVSGHPEPELTWYRDDMEMDRYCGLPKYEIFRNGKKHSLHIYKCTEDDAAIYQASARNSKGIVSCSGVLEVGTMTEYKIHQRWFAKLKQKADAKRRELEESRKRGKENLEQGDQLRTVSPERAQRKRRSPGEANIMSATSLRDKEKGVKVHIQDPESRFYEAEAAGYVNGFVTSPKGMKVTGKENMSQENSLDNDDQFLAYIYETVEIITKRPPAKDFPGKKKRKTKGEDEGEPTNQQEIKSPDVVQIDGRESSEVWNSGQSLFQYLAESAKGQASETTPKSSKRMCQEPASPNFPALEEPSSGEVYFSLKDIYFDNSFEKVVIKKEDFPQERAESLLPVTLADHERKPEEAVKGCQLQEWETLNKEVAELDALPLSVDLQPALSSGNTTSMLISDKGDEEAEMVVDAGLPPETVMQSYNQIEKKGPDSLQPDLTVQQLIPEVFFEVSALSLYADCILVAEAIKTNISSGFLYINILSGRLLGEEGGEDAKSIDPWKLQATELYLIEQVLYACVKKQTNKQTCCREAPISRGSRAKCRTAKSGSGLSPKAYTVHINQPPLQLILKQAPFFCQKEQTKKPAFSIRVDLSCSLPPKGTESTLGQEGSPVNNSSTSIKLVNVCFASSKKGGGCRKKTLLEQQGVAGTTSISHLTIKICENTKPRVPQALSSDSARSSEEGRTQRGRAKGGARERKKEKEKNKNEEGTEEEKNPINVTKDEKHASTEETRYLENIIPPGVSVPQHIMEDSESYFETKKYDQEPLLLPTDGERKPPQIKGNLVSEPIVKVVPEMPLSLSPLSETVVAQDLPLVMLLRDVKVGLDSGKNIALAPLTEKTIDNVQSITLSAKTKADIMSSTTTEELKEKPLSVPTTFLDHTQMNKISKSNTSVPVSLVTQDNPRKARTAMTVPTTEESGSTAVPSIVVGDTTLEDNTIKMEKTTENLPIIPSATPEELASGARRKIFVHKPKQSDESEHTPPMERRSPIVVSKMSNLEAPVSPHSPTMERRSPTVAHKMTTLEVPKLYEEPMDKSETTHMKKPESDKIIYPEDLKQLNDPFRANKSKLLLRWSPQVIRKVRAEQFSDASGNLKLWCQFFNVLSDSTITWYRDEIPITEVRRSAGDEAQVALAIVQASSMDCGVYQCTIQNKYGIDSTDFLLSFEVLSGFISKEDIEVGEEIEMTPMLFRKGLTDSEYWGDKFFGRIVTEEMYLGEGCLRKACRVKVIYGLDPIFESGSTCIIKVRNPIAYGTNNENNLIERNREITIQECKIQNTTKEYCKIFAAEARAVPNFGQALGIIPLHMIYRPANNIPYATIEEEMKGHFVKYCSKDSGGNLIARNDSEIEQKCCTFQHWIYQWTNGDLLVTDLEGAGGKITNVRIATKSKGYQGLKENCSLALIEQFITLHQCNHYCELLGLRSLKTTDTLQQPAKPKGSKSPSFARKTTSTQSSPQIQKKSFGSPQATRRGSLSPKAIRRASISGDTRPTIKHKTVEIPKSVRLR